MIGVSSPAISDLYDVTTSVREWRMGAGSTMEIKRNRQHGYELWQSAKGHSIP